MTKNANVLRLILPAVGIMLLAGACAPDPNKERIAKAEDAIRAMLKDPESAKFSDVRANASMVCGKVNAKNSYGGYPGSKRFYVTDSKAIVESDDPEIQRIVEPVFSLCPP